MTTVNPAADVARERARLARATRRARAHSIRRRVVAGALALFVAAWVLIAVVLVSGHDPALSTRTSAASSSQAVTPSVASGGSGSSSSQGSSSSPSAASSAPLTTRSS